MIPKHVIITGSTRGIGFGLAYEFLKRGHRVCIHGSSEKSISLVKPKLVDFSDQTTFFAGNVADINMHQRLFDHTKQVFGSVDIWINNAGISNTNIATDKLDLNEIEKLYAINITGMSAGSVVALKNMKQQGHGQIFNMEGFGSDGRMMKNMTVYGTSKRALRYFTHSLAKEAAHSPIQVGTLSPGMVITDLILDSLKTTDPKELDRTKNIFNILGERVETVTPFLVEGILKSRKNNASIAYLTNGKVMWKFMKSLFKKNDFFADSTSQP